MGANTGEKGKDAFQHEKCRGETFWVYLAGGGVWDGLEWVIIASGMVNRTGWQADCVYGTDRRDFTTKLTKGAKRREDILPQRSSNLRSNDPDECYRNEKREGEGFAVGR